MNILQYFANLFSSPVNKKNSRLHNENSITFVMDGFGKSWVSLNLTHTDHKACENFANLLNSICSGKYQTHILDMVVSMSKEQQELSAPLQLILVQWGLLLSKSENDEENKSTSVGSNKSRGNKPFIRPRNTFIGNG